MKLLYKLLSLSFLLLTIVACDKDYDMPPLNEPKYEGAAANITIAQLKEKYKDATQDKAATITDDLILKAVIGADDKSGNIYKQLYIQDETGGMSFQVDQGSVYSNYAQGQTIYINLKGLCVSVYGGEQQLGDPNGYLYRTPYETFKEKVAKDGWPDVNNIKIKEFSNIAKLSDDANANVWTVIRLTGVHFENGGTATFAPEDGYGTQNLKDANGNSIVVRTSNYADFASNKLPVGTGTVVAVLGRFNSSWQLTIRSIDDVYGFDGQQPGGGDTPVTPEEGTIFYETLGDKTIEKVNNYWPYLKDFTGWSSTGLKFEDVNNTMSARAVNGVNNIWFPSGKENDLKITGFSTEGYKKLTLTYDVAANLYNDQGEQNANAMTGTFNGQAFATPSQILSGPNGDNNKFYTITIDLPVSAASATSELHFITTAAANTMGLRLANIKLVGEK